MQRSSNRSNGLSLPNSVRTSLVSALQKGARDLAVLALAGALFLPFAATVRAQVPSSWSNVRVPNHVLRLLPQATQMPRRAEASNEEITIALAMNPSNPAGMENYELGHRDPQSPNFRRALQIEEVTVRFSPTQQAYDSVLQYLLAQGFQLVEGSANRMVITVRGTRGLAERTFNLRINDYKLGKLKFRANDRDPELPAEIALYVSAVDGLSDANRRHPAQANTTGSPNPATIGSVATAYNKGGFPNISGAGQVIGLMEDDNFNWADLEASLTANGLPVQMENQVTQYAIGGGVPVGGGTGEVIGDIIAALGVAPGATIVVFDINQNTPYSTAYNDVLQAVLSMQGGSGGIVSQSWASCEVTSAKSIADSVNSLLSRATVSNLSFFAASGDTGQYCNLDMGGWTTDVYFPADLPSAVAVGGTFLNVYQTNNAYYNEQWWDSTCGAANGCVAGGFGTSAEYASPSWQSGLSATGMRSVPDVAADASQSTGFITCVTPTNGSAPVCGPCAPGQGQISGCFGGTSMATPIWAATWALVSQAYAQGTCGTTACTITANDGILYLLAGQKAFLSPSNPSCSLLFHSAPCMTQAGNDFQHVGLGSPNISNLIAALSLSPYITSISPASGLDTGGTSVTVNGFMPSPAEFYFGSNLATNVSCSSMTTCTVTSPTGGPGSVQVTGYSAAEPSNLSNDVLMFGNPQITFEYFIPVPPPIRCKIIAGREICTP